jgi:hypothetical protein
MKRVGLPPLLAWIFFFLHSELHRMQNEDIYDLISVMHYLKGIMTFYNEES